jgi:hypothetical protein
MFDQDETIGYVPREKPEKEEAPKPPRKKYTRRCFCGGEKDVLRLNWLETHKAVIETYAEWLGPDSKFKMSWIMLFVRGKRVRFKPSADIREAIDSAMDDFYVMQLK